MHFRIFMTPLTIILHPFLFKTKMVQEAPKTSNNFICYDIKFFAEEDLEQISTSKSGLYFINKISPGFLKMADKFLENNFFHS